MTIDQLTTYINKQVAKDKSIAKIILFGSQATGSALQDSDVDLLVIRNKKGTLTQRYAEVSALFYPRRFPMDIIIKTAAEYGKRLSLGDPFFKEIERSGVAVYER